MTWAFIEVMARSFKNRIALQVRRMKQPRYLAGAVFAAMYVWWFLFKNRKAGVLIASLGATELRLDIVAVIILAILLFAWALPSDSGGLPFSEAEIAMLFPAPLRRRDLLLYKIIRAQPSLLISAIAFTILGAFTARFFGIWIAFTTITVYLMLVALGRARLRLAGIGFIPRLIAVSVIAIALVNVALMTNGIRFTRNMTLTPQTVASIGHRFFEQPFVHAVLYVPRLFAMAIFPKSIANFAVIAPVLIAMTVIFFFLADRLNVSFEEASVDRAKRRNETRERMLEQRSGTYVRFRRLTAPFRLTEGGRPEVAILWKNVIATIRLSLGKIIVFVAIFVVIFAFRFLVPDVDSDFLSTMFLILSIILPILGPTLFKEDLRLDLQRMEMLKSYPLSGDLIVAAEIAAPLTVISLFEVAALLCFLGSCVATGKGPLSIVTTTQAAICALIVAVPFCALQLLLRNAFPVLFPAWSTRPKEEVRGFAVGGQRLLMLFLSMVVLGILLIPAAIVFIPCVMIAQHFFAGSPIASALTTVPAAAVLAAEVWMGVRFLGGRFDELDVSVEFDTVSV